MPISHTHKEWPRSSAHLSLRSIACQLRVTYIAIIMGDTVSLANSKDRHVPLRGFSVVCDDCGLVFYVSHDIVSGRDSKKRCSR